MRKKSGGRTNTSKKILIRALVEYIQCQLGVLMQFLAETHTYTLTCTKVKCEIPAKDRSRFKKSPFHWPKEMTWKKIWNYSRIGREKVIATTRLAAAAAVVAMNDEAGGWLVYMSSIWTCESRCVSVFSLVLGSVWSLVGACQPYHPIEWRIALTELKVVNEWNKHTNTGHFIRIHKMRVDHMYICA